jgi:hypothetical protein
VVAMMRAGKWECGTQEAGAAGVMSRQMITVISTQGDDGRNQDRSLAIVVVFCLFRGWH